VRIAFVAYLGSIHTRRWVSFFAERGHEVHVVTCGGFNPLEDQGYEVHDLGAPRFGKLGYLLKVRRARRVLRKIAPDVVHAHYATSYGLLALAAGIDPLVVTAHGDDVLISPRSRPMRAIVTRVLKAAQLITVPSEQMREAVEQLVAPEEREIAVFQYGVEVARLAKLGNDRRNEVAAMSREDVPPVLRIVSARALEPIYRLDTLLEALALLKARKVAFVADMLGDGALRGELEQQVRDLDLAGCVAFRGHQPIAEVERSIAVSDIYVSVAESDGASIALLEALALGALPVLSDIPSNRAWVEDGHGGTLVEGTPEAIADGILRAALLDRESVISGNLRLVAERADRATNLAACELMIDSLVGVTFDRNPTTGDADSDAA
jgi:glycosyltransferase involved in cell wall biosynthesis